jgi:ribosome maturation factor RimP
LADEEVVMRGSSRHGLSRPDQAGRPSADDAAPRRGRPADVERLTALLEPVVGSAGMDLESVRISAAGRRRLLRIVVDADNRPGLDEIAVVSRSVSAELDTSGVMGQAAYTLEVSSPGVDRPLTEPRHWRRAIGRLVRAPLAHPVPEAATAPPAAGITSRQKRSPSSPTEPASTEPGRYPTAVLGRVVAAGADAVMLEIDGERREFGYRDLGPGRVQVEFGNAGAAGAAFGTSGDEGERDGH